MIQAKTAFTILTVVSFVILCGCHNQLSKHTYSEKEFFGTWKFIKTIERSNPVCAEKEDTTVTDFKEPSDGMTLFLHPDGKYSGTRVRVIGNEVGETADSGTWSIRQNDIVFSSGATGDTLKAHIIISGKKLSLTFKEFNRTVVHTLEKIKQ